MLRAILYLAIAMVASSAIATEVAVRSQTVTCSGANVNVNGNTALKQTLAHETCVANLGKH